jgi:hypothetical protein
MRFLMLGIVMLFPLLDLVVTARFARWSGVPMWMWLTGSAIAGLCVLTHERAQFRTRTLAAFRGDQSLMRGLLVFGSHSARGHENGESKRGQILHRRTLGNLPWAVQGGNGVRQELPPFLTVILNLIATLAI